MGKVTEEVIAKPVAANNVKKAVRRKGKVSGRKRSRSSRPKRNLSRRKKRGKRDKKMETAMRSLRNRVLLEPPPRRIVTKDISN